MKNTLKIVAAGVLGFCIGYSKCKNRIDNILLNVACKQLKEQKQEEEVETEEA